MIVHIAVPVHYLRCKVWTDETRDWSVVHEVILLDLARTCLTLDALCEDTLLPRQVVIAALARLMRHKTRGSGLGRRVRILRGQHLGCGAGARR